MPHFPEKSTALKNLDPSKSVFFSFLFSKSPSSKKSLFEAHTRREYLLFHFYKALGKVPGHPPSLTRKLVAETRRHRSTAADLSRLFLACLAPPGSSLQSRPTSLVQG